MRSKEESDLLRRDKKLLGLADAMNPALIASASALSAAQLQLDYIRYKPATNALLRYRNLNAQGDEFHYVKTFTESAGEKKAGSLCKAPATCDAPLAIGGYSLMYRFPQDAQLRSLWKLNGKQVKWAQRLQLPDQIDNTYQVLAYKPERRCVLKLTAATPSIVKFYTQSAWRTAYDNARYAVRDFHVATPSVLAKSRRYGLLRFEFLSGPTLREAILAGRAASACVDVGRQLAQLHSSGAVELGVMTRAAEVQALARSVSLLRWLLPDEGAYISELAQQLCRWLYSEPLQLGVCHGDYYDKQIILNASGPMLLDFDQAHLGDWRGDVANFIAHLVRLQLPDESAVMDRFLAGYQQQRSKSFAGLGPYVAYALLKLCHHPFRTGDPDWPVKTRRLLQLVHQWLNQTETQS